LRNRICADGTRAHSQDVGNYRPAGQRGKNGAARLLGLKATTLEARMKKLGIKRKRGGSEI